MASLGGYKGKQVAFPFAGYANVLAYRKDLYEAAGLKPPETMEDMVADAVQADRPDQEDYGFVANGQKGPAVAQDWMQYNRQMGGSILDKDGKPALNSPANIESLAVYKKLFDKAAPPGAADYDWGGREESFRQGLVAKMQTWSVGAAGYDDPKVSKVAGKVGIVLSPSGQGPAEEIRHRRLGLGINADIDAKKKEAAWAFIKWLTSPAVHKEFNLRGAGSYLRKSEMTDPELLAKYPFLPVIAKSFEHGDGEYRPRIPQYPQIQDMIGGASMRCWSARPIRRRRSTAAGQGGGCSDSNDARDGCACRRVEQGRSCGAEGRPSVEHLRATPAFGRAVATTPLADGDRMSDCSLGRPADWSSPTPASASFPRRARGAGARLRPGGRGLAAGPGVLYSFDNYNLIRPARAISSASTTISTCGGPDGARAR